MNITECKVGQRVFFGRAHGEKTLGEIVKVNRAKLKIKQLESRGTMRSYAVGTVWTVPPTLCEPTNVSAPPAIQVVMAGETLGYVPKVKRTDREIFREILGLYTSLSPELLSCDGELSRTQVAARESSLRARLRKCFAEIGRIVSEDEAYNSLKG